MAFWGPRAWVCTQIMLVKINHKSAYFPLSWPIAPSGSTVKCRKEFLFLFLPGPSGWNYAVRKYVQGMRLAIRG